MLGHNDSSKGIEVSLKYAHVEATPTARLCSMIKFVGKVPQKTKQMVVSGCDHPLCYSSNELQGCTVPAPNWLKMNVQNEDLRFFFTGL